MHQCIAQWIGDSVEIVDADSSFGVATADLEIWSGQGIRCISREAWEGEILKMANFKLDTVQEIASEESS